jgi:hypothetical protein
MDQIRVAKSIFESKPEVKIKVGRPSMRWPEHVEIDL